jgi:phage shock protein C
MSEPMNEQEEKKTPKRLYRSNNKKICGVAGGIAEYFDLDPTLMRLLWILFAFMSCSTGVIAYLICALVIPQSPQ